MHNALDAVNRNAIAVHMQDEYRQGMPTARTRVRPTAKTLTPGQWLAAAMNSASVDQVQLERMSGIDQTMISRAVKHNRVSDRVLVDLAKALRATVPADVLAQTSRGRSARGAPQPEIRTAMSSLVTGAKPTRPGFDVPVWHAFPVRRGPLFHLQTAPMEFAWRPAALSATRRVFMLRMPGVSMMPWRDADEPIYFDPDTPLDQAKHAMLQLDIDEPQDICVICRLLSPPQVGSSPKARIYCEPRRSSIPDAPIRRAFAALEWKAIITT